MSDIITNRFVTHEGLQDYDMLLKSWLPDISHSVHQDMANKNKHDVNINAASNALYFQKRTKGQTGTLDYMMRGQRAGAKIWMADKGAQVGWSGDDKDHARYFFTFKSVDGNGASDSSGYGPFTILQIPAWNDQHFCYVVRNNGESGTQYTLLDTRNINTTSLDETVLDKYPVSKINIEKVAATSTNTNNYWLLSSPENDSYQPYRLEDVQFNPSTNTLAVPKLKLTQSTYHATGGTIIGGIDMNNSNIINIQGLFIGPCDGSDSPRVEGLFFADKDMPNNKWDRLIAYKGAMYIQSGVSTDTDLENFHYRILTAEVPKARVEDGTGEASKLASHDVERPVWVSSYSNGGLKECTLAPAKDELTYNSYTKTLTGENITATTFKAKILENDSFTAENLTIQSTVGSLYLKTKAAYSIVFVASGTNCMQIYGGSDANIPLGSLYPLGTSGTRDLGTSSNQWRTVYANTFNGTAGQANKIKINGNYYTLSYNSSSHTLSFST